MGEDLGPMVEEVKREGGVLKIGENLAEDQIRDLGQLQKFIFWVGLHFTQTMEKYRILLELLALGQACLNRLLGASSLLR